MNTYDIYLVTYLWSNGDIHRREHIFYLCGENIDTGKFNALGATKEIEYIGTADIESFPVQYPILNIADGRLIEAIGKEPKYAMIVPKKKPVKKKRDSEYQENKKEIAHPEIKNSHPIVGAIKNNVILFTIGAAGTGKTYTSVLIATHYLKLKEFKRIILIRPAVDSGEDIGYLPGDILEKMDPYLSPLYDSLDSILGVQERKRLLNAGIIEVVPIGFLRGRSLTDSFIIMDESQNATYSQLKMIITRLGEGSKLIINGDPTQIDLHHKNDSGLLKIMQTLSDIEMIGMVYLPSTNIYRHPLLKRIIARFEESEK